MHCGRVHVNYDDHTLTDIWLTMIRARNRPSHPSNGLLKCIALVIALGLLAQAGWQGYALHRRMAQDKPPAMTTDQGTMPALLGARDIARLAWFGSAPEDAALLGNAQSAGVNVSHYTLKGVSVSADPAFSGAYISIGGGPEHYYRAGETLPDGGWVIGAVLADQVILAQGTNRATLVMPAPSTPRADGAALSPTGNASVASRFVTLPPDAPTPPPVALSTGEVARRFLDNPGALLAQAGLEPVSAGEQQGYRFTGQDAQGVFDNRGIVAGDIVLAVNGKAVGNPKGDRALIPTLALQKKLTLDVKRGEQTITIDYPLP